MKNLKNLSTLTHLLESLRLTRRTDETLRSKLSIRSLIRVVVQNPHQESANHQTRCPVEALEQVRLTSNFHSNSLFQVPLPPLRAREVVGLILKFVFQSALLSSVFAGDFVLMELLSPPTKTGIPKKEVRSLERNLRNFILNLLFDSKVVGALRIGVWRPASPVRSLRSLPTWVLEGWLNPSGSGSLRTVGAGKDRQFPVQKPRCLFPVFLVKKEGLE